MNAHSAARQAEAETSHAIAMAMAKDFLRATRDADFSGAAVLITLETTVAVLLASLALSGDGEGVPPASERVAVLLDMMHDRVARRIEALLVLRENG